MNLRHRLFATGLDALAAVRIHRWLPGPGDAAGFVLTLHHVRPPRDAAFDPNAHLSITPAFLDRLIARFRSDGWRFVPLDALIEARGAGTDHRRIAITIDDGFVDILRHALPVFRGRQVPFTLYVVPGFCDRSAPIWWEALERIIAGNGEVGLDGAGLPPPRSCRTADEKAAAFGIWANALWRIGGETQRREVLARLAETHGVDLTGLTAELVMGWDEVRGIAADPLCTLGAHTVTHPFLARLPAEEAAWEMSESAAAIERETGTRPATIAFPYGTRDAAGRREGLIARDCGFSAAFTTRPGYLPRDGGRHLVPRISVNGCMQQTSRLRALLTPGIWALPQRLWTPPLPA